jgi:hypothetical protein
MMDKPKRASEYESEQTELVRATCLYVATKLGDLMEDLVIVGGLVPSLIVDQTDLPEGADAHVGTMDLDVGLQLADEPDAKQAIEILRRDFGEVESVGPRRVAEFITGGADDDLQADVVGFVGELLGKALG